MNRAAVAISASLAWLALVRWLKERRREHMEELAVRAIEGSGSVWRVHNLLTANEFRLEAWLAMSSRGLLLTYAIPTISSVLVSTGGFASDVERRYADMELLIREFSENAIDGTEQWDGQPERAQMAIKRLNAIHAQYGSLILMKDMQYVLSIFMLTPALWCDSPWAWRRMTQKEKACVYLHWMAIGRRMNIELDTSDTGDWRDFDSVVDFKRRYEGKHQRYRATNEQVARSTVEYFVKSFPTRPLRQAVGCLALNALSSMQEDPKHSAALGLPSNPPILLRLGIDLLLRARAFFCTYLVPPLPLAWTDRLTARRPSPSSGGCPFHFYAPRRALDFGNKQYGPGKPYALEQLGPASVAAGLLEDKPRYRECA